MVEMTARPRSAAAFAEAEALFPGGVNSPVRAYRSVGGNPVFLAKGKGAVVTDLDGHQYIDFVQSWGAHILGHAPASVVTALKRRASLGTSFGAPTADETVLGSLIRDAVPSMEKLRFVNSGTEAVMSALRLARGATGRPYVLKFDGCYHGHADFLLVQAGSGLATAGLPDSGGVPSEFTAFTISVPFNDLDAVRKAFEKHPKSIAAVIVEPAAANMGLVRPLAGFLEGLRAMTKADGALLIFDEVITGFRVELGGAQARFGIEPDLTTLGKIIGGGLPVGAYGGRRDLMDLLAPLGPVYQAGTLSGNPAAMAAGIAVLKQVAVPGFYERLRDKAEVFYRELSPLLDPERHMLQSCGSLYTLFFTSQPVKDFASAKTSDTAEFARVFRALLDQGVLTAPSQFEANFIGAAHTPAQLKKVVQAYARALLS
jgi:glutamate-1-semialdehyde 2,1-aminomutase